MLGIPAAAGGGDGFVERVAPFWRVDGQFETRLMINNIRAEPRNVRFEVYDAGGRRLPTRSLRLAALESTEVDLSDLLGGRGGFGQIALLHDGEPLDVAGHVMIMHRRRAIVFDEHFRLRSQFLSSRLAGVSDLGVSPAASSLVVANTGAERRRVSLQGIIGRRRVSKNISIEPRHTRFMPLTELFGGELEGGRDRNDTAVAIEVDHDGARGEVLVQGLLMSRGGKGANLRLADRARLVSQRAVSPALRPDAGQRPRLALYNLGASDLAVTPVVHYRVGESEAQSLLTPIVLRRGEVWGDDLSASLAALPAGSRELGLSLEYDGAPGSLVAELLLLASGDRPVVPATPKDPEGEGEGAMTFAWRLENGATTVIALANPSADEELAFHLHLFFDGGAYTWDGAETLQPGEVRHIDIRQLRDQQIPGQDGTLLPAEAAGGQAKVVVGSSEGQFDKIIGQAIQIGAQGAMTSSLGCAVCPPDPSYVALSPLSFTGNIGTSQQIYPWIHWSDGSSFINTNPYAIDWYPNNGSIATVSEAWYNFQVQFQGPGTTTIDAEMPNECHYVYDYQTSQCTCQYVVPVWAQQAAQVTTTSNCFAQLKYRPVYVLDYYAGNHSFWWIQDSTSTHWVADAGPQGSCPLNCGYLVDWVTQGDVGHYPDDNSNASLAWSSGVSSSVCTQVTNLYNYAVNWPQTTYSYEMGSSPNSNTFSHWAGNAAPFSPTAPPNAPGW